MKLRRAEPLSHSLLQDTVLDDWFYPQQQALDKVRYCDGICQSLAMMSITLLAGLRQLLSINSLRDHTQSLFHWDEEAQCPAVPRSSGSDAMNSGTRRDILREAVGQLVVSARACIPDKFSAIDGLGQRPVLAIDAS